MAGKAGPFIDADQRQRPRPVPAGSPNRRVFSSFWTAQNRASITPARPLVTRTGANAQVAQLVEHVTENHGVGGSIPPLGTIALFAQLYLHSHACSGLASRTARGYGRLRIVSASAARCLRPSCPPHLATLPPCHLAPCHLATLPPCVLPTLPLRPFDALGSFR
jgi:hypothetical protein